MRLPIILAGGLVFSIILTGCRSKDRFEFYPTSPVVEWSDLAPEHTARFPDGYQIVVPDKTSGVFPTSIAVARVSATGAATSAATDELENAADGEFDSASSRFTLDMKPDVDFLTWNRVFDDFRSVSEVFPLNIMALDGAEVTLGNLIAAASDLEAGLLLVYAEIHTTPHDSEMRGALYRIPTGQVLALIRSDVHVADPVSPGKKGHRASIGPDGEWRDPRLAAIREFDLAARGCLLELMAADEPTDVTAPEGWIPDRPLEPVEWPPVEDRYRRRK